MLAAHPVAQTTMNIAVIGGGIGLYRTLLGLRGPGRSLTAVISGLSRPNSDDVLDLPPDDASRCLVALARHDPADPGVSELLAHRLQQRDWRGACFGPFFLAALAETRGSRHAAIEDAGRLIGLDGSIALAFEPGAHGSDGISPSAVAAIAGADVVVLASGDLETDLFPVLCSPGIIGALHRSPAVKVFVARIGGDQAQTNAASDRAALETLTGCFLQIVETPEDLWPREPEALGQAS